MSQAAAREGGRERLRVGKEEGREGRKERKAGRQAGRKEGRRQEREREARQEEWTLPMASRSLCQVPMEGWALGAEGGPGGASQRGQLVQVVVNSGKGARSQARSGHEP